MNSDHQKLIRQSKIDTRLIHHGESFAAETGTIMPPIFPSSTYEHGNKEGFDYTRSGNPNFRILESILASLEECEYATVFGSGVSAITAIASSLKSGDIIMCEENLYGCTVRLFEKVFEKFNLKTIKVDFSNEDNIKLIEEQKPNMIWIESPTNPLLKVIDIEQICSIANIYKIPVVVDNTFCTALIQKPIELGATLSLTSTTKYLNGHSDALGGSVCTNQKEWQENMIFAQKSLGLQPSPFDCWLITRGIKTLSLRLKKQVSNAETIVNYLSKQKTIEWVIYPFKEDHPNNKLAKKQMKSGGAIITLKIRKNQEEVYKFCKRLRFFKMAESLGGVESLICHPSTMTHASISKEIKNKIGINESLVRLSIGCEDPIDLINDLDQALN